jgi:hypothetical protein
VQSQPEDRDGAAIAVVGGALDDLIVCRDLSEAGEGAAVVGGVSANRRKFCQTKSSPATIASRSMTCPSGGDNLAHAPGDAGVPTGQLEVIGEKVAQRPAAGSSVVLKYVGLVALNGAPGGFVPQYTVSDEEACELRGLPGRASPPSRGRPMSFRRRPDSRGIVGLAGALRALTVYYGTDPPGAPSSFLTQSGWPRLRDRRSAARMS